MESFHPSASPTVFHIAQVFAGESADITSSMLKTEDLDTPVEQLVYNVEAPVNGMVALKEAPEEGVLNFTQSQINRGEIIFVHEGKGVRVRGYSMPFISISYMNHEPDELLNG